MSAYRPAGSLSNWSVKKLRVALLDSDVYASIALKLAPRIAGRDFTEAGSAFRKRASFSAL